MIRNAPEAIITEPEEEDDEITESQDPNQNKNVETVEDEIENKVESSRKVQQFILPDERRETSEEKVKNTVEMEVEQVRVSPKENEISAEIVDASHATFVQDTKDSIVSQNVYKKV